MSLDFNKLNTDLLMQSTIMAQSVGISEFESPKGKNSASKHTKFDDSIIPRQHKKDFPQFPGIIPQAQQKLALFNRRNK